MRPLLPAAILLCFLNPSSGGPARSAAQTDAGGVLQRLTIANFGGSGTNTIQAGATDPNGDIFVAGTTNSPDFPVKNAFQPAFADASLLRSTDLGNTWTRVPAPLDVSSIYPDPVSPQILFGGGKAGIYKSSDSGMTWQVVYPFQSGVSLASLAIDPGNHLRIAATFYSLTGLGGAGSLIRSLDGGATWVSACPLQGCGGQLIADPSGSGAMAMGGSPGPLYLSRDWGMTFNPIYPTGALGTPSTLAFDPSHPGWIYAEVSAGSTGTLWFSTDFGATWTKKASPQNGFTNIMDLAVDPNIPTTLVAAAGGIYLSTDGAASWKLTAGPGGAFLPAPQDPFALLGRQCSGGGLFAIGDGVDFAGTFTVAFSPDDGVTWNAPHLTHVISVAAGAGCAAYVTRSAAANGSDAFVAKIAPNGKVLWATYLGGSDRDTPAGLAVDSQGNAYVAGTTYSADFPSTAARNGVPGMSSAFVTKFWPDGTLGYSVLIGGEATNTATAVVVDSGQNAYVIGSTNSIKFPVTPGALVSQLGGSYTGFFVKLSSTGAELAGTYLGQSYVEPTSILAGADGNPILAGVGGPVGLPTPPLGNQPNFIMKMDGTASQVLSAAYLSGLSGGNPVLLAAAPDGNVLIAAPSDTANLATPGAYVSPTSFSNCGLRIPYFGIAGGLYVAKLRAADWSVVFAAQLKGACGAFAGTMALDSAGAVVLGLGAGAGFALHNPMLAGPPDSSYSSAIAKLSADGSALQFATYLDDCGPPAIAVAADGSIFAGVSSVPCSSTGPAGVLHLTTANPPPISLDWISNAFSGDSNAVVAGGLYTITGTGFQPPSIDLGLNPSQNLPTELGGVQVKFGDIPAAIMKTAPGQVTVVAPEKLVLLADAAAREAKLDDRFATVQLFYNGVASNAVLMPVAAFLPGLLTLEYPNPDPDQTADGNVRNQDGTPNDVNHPAAPGSTVTFYATGLGATKPPTLAPGAIATSTAAVPVTPLYSYFQPFSFTPPTPYPVSSLPGFVSAMFQIQVPIPTSLSGLGGTVVGNGVTRLVFGLLPGPPIPEPVAAISNAVNVYVK
jgi:uncharacterized protein (TIGR03437 family)